MNASRAAVPRISCRHGTQIDFLSRATETVESGHDHADRPCLRRTTAPSGLAPAAAAGFGSAPVAPVGLLTPLAAAEGSAGTGESDGATDSGIAVSGSGSC